jgi:hypothetical protein
MTLNLDHDHDGGDLASEWDSTGTLKHDTKAYNPEHDFGTGYLPLFEPPPMTLEQIEADLRRIDAKLTSLETWAKAQGCEL